MELAFCYECLTGDDRHEAAVTLVEGTALCEKCARAWAELERRMGY
jgi:hypothetical protein